MGTGRADDPASQARRPPARGECPRGSERCLLRAFDRLPVPAGIARSVYPQGFEGRVRGHRVGGSTRGSEARLTTSIEATGPPTARKSPTHQRSGSVVHNPIWHLPDCRDRLDEGEKGHD
jgi:hypothetical protein